MERESIPFLIWGSEKELREYSEKTLGPMLRDCPKVGTVIDLTKEEVQTLENSTGDASIRSEFYLIPNDEDQTIIVGIMGADVALTLSKAKAQLLAQLILGQVQKWET